MRGFASGLLALSLSVGAGACDSNVPSGGASGQGGAAATRGATAGSGGVAAIGGAAGAAAAGGAAARSGGGAAIGGGGGAAAGGAAGSAPAECLEAGDASVLGIASIPLNGPQPPRFLENVQLLGEGLDLTLMPQQNVAGGLRWRGDRMFLVADPGFWDITAQGDARWNDTTAVLVWGVREGDLDRDGDQDLVVLKMEPNSEPPGGEMFRPFMSRVTAWERTPAGLIERGEVMRTSEMRVGMAYAIGDVDEDGDLDVVGFDQGVPMGYLNQGAFAFTPSPLAERFPELAGKGALTLELADRNQDRSLDLLIVVGNFVGDPLETSMFVMLGDASGKLGPPGPMVHGRTPLVPNGPDGSGIGIADVTGDGLADILSQAAESTDAAPILRLYASTSATSLAPAVELKAHGFEFADVDEDGETDIVTTVNGRLSTLSSRGDGEFEPRDLGVSMAQPQVKDFVVDPGLGAAPATLHVLYNLDSCPACGAGCSGQCLFGTCVGCLADADCSTGRCEAQGCVP